jgi:hypothetical protein
MQWKITIEGVDEFGTAHRSEIEITKDFDRLSSGEIGFSVEDGKVIMAHLQSVILSQRTPQNVTCGPEHCKLSSMRVMPDAVKSP